jgi:hypothetical protein
MSNEIRQDLGHLNLVGLTDMATEWNITRQRVQVLTLEKTFPAPAIKMYGPNGKVAHRLWVKTEVNEWRRKQMRGR